ncbi:MAG: uracil-DNA glycosylase family protein [Boseongicola sp. SB0675_bin_26]|nr:uracil-DNA glycosylase family protein [Boseongicola sp. SB0675_bin_26]
MDKGISDLKKRLGACNLCTARFAATATGHRPRPVVWFESTARLLVAGQAPGRQVHEIGIPFKDRSGDRLRNWMGVDELTFYDTSRVAIVPMAFCFPGYSTDGSDLPPPTACAQTWRARVLDSLPAIRLTLLVGAHAHAWHLGLPRNARVTETVRDWKSRLPDAFPLPHPSWRNTAWLSANPWFETDLLPELKACVQEALA